MAHNIERAIENDELMSSQPKDGENTALPIQETTQKLTEKFEKLQIEGKGQVCTYSLHCPHILSDASYNDLKDLSIKLDHERRGGPCKGIMDLMRHLLKKEEKVIKIWRCCRGGNVPAMDFLNYMITRGTSLREFQTYLDARQTPVVDCLKRYVRKYSLDKLIGDIDHADLEELAEKLSVNPGPHKSIIQYTWKDVAGKAGLNMSEINLLDAYCHQSWETQSITENFIKYWTSSSPVKIPVLDLVKGLHAIERHDIVNECDIFKSCREICLKDEIDLT